MEKDTKLSALFGSSWFFKRQKDQKYDMFDIKQIGKNFLFFIKTIHHLNK
jgi:hypothetical protein